MYTGNGTLAVDKQLSAFKDHDFSKPDQYQGKKTENHPSIDEPKEETKNKVVSALSK